MRIPDLGRAAQGLSADLTALGGALAEPAQCVLARAELAVELTGSRSEIVHRPLPVDDPERRRPDITRARERLGWQPTVALREGLERTIRWFRSVDTADFRAPTPNY